MTDLAERIERAAARLSRFAAEWRVRVERKQSTEEIYALHMGDPREAVCDVRDIETLVQALRAREAGDGE